MRPIALLIPLLAFALAPSLAEPSAAPPQGPLATVAPGVVDGATARALVAAGAVVIDVRSAREFAAGHVPGARNVPYDEIAERALEIGPPSTPVVVYCQSGRRSAIAAEALRTMGFARVWDLQRYDAWPAAAPAAR